MIAYLSPMQGSVVPYVKPPHQGSTYFRRVGAENVECSEADYNSQFLTITGQVEVERLNEFSDGFLRHLLGDEGYVDANAAARLFAWFAKPPEYSLPGLSYEALDPDCPEVDPEGDLGFELAYEWLPDEAVVTGHELEIYEHAQLKRFLPHYLFPWESEAGVWPSHLGALLVYLHTHPAIYSSLREVGAV